MAVRQIHTDNGSEFINHALISQFPEVMGDAFFARGRPGFKNDNRFVEQKNGSLVRAYLHDLYLFTPEHVSMLNSLYADMRVYYNCFQPVLRQAMRQAVVYSDGICRIIRRHDTAKTPLERLLSAKPPIASDTADELRGVYERTNPRKLKRRIHQNLDRLYHLSQHDERRKALYV